MATIDDPKSGAGADGPRPFVVSDPCPDCDGQGAVDGQPCHACQSTGVGRFFHGTKADLKPGDLLAPGFAPNFGDRERMQRYVYFTGTLDAATWGAELAVGDGPGRIYVVVPTGPLEDDPNLTDQKIPGNPSKSYRSGEPLRVTSELSEWQGHSPEAIKAMKDGIEELKRQGHGPVD